MGDQSTLEVTAKLSERGNTINTSFDEKKAEVLAAVIWLLYNQDPETHAIIYADSQSLCTALKKRIGSTSTIRSYPHSHKPKVTFQWFPGHSDVSGNEIADSESRTVATTTETEPEPTSLRVASICIRRTFREPEPSHRCAMRTYKGYKLKPEAKTIKCKKDAVLLKQLQGRHCKLLKSHANLMDPTVDPTCPLCAKEPHTFEHWLDCPVTSKDRQETFGTTEPQLELPTEEPDGAVALAC